MKKATAMKTIYGVASSALIAALVAGCGTSSSNTGSSGGSNGTSTSNATTSSGTSTTGANQTSNSSSSSGSKDVTIGYVNWDEDVAATYLWKDLLTQKGYHVTLKTLDAGPLFAGLSEGGLDLFFDTWLPATHKAYMQRYGAKLTDLGQWYQGKTEEGFAIPSYVTDVKTMADLEKHASEFGGRIVGIEPGAGEMGQAAKAIKDYGLNNLKLVQSSTPAMLSQLKKDYAAKKPIVVTMWSPHWAVTAYKLKYIPDPKGDFGGTGHIQTEANKNWASNNPTVSGWIGNFKLTPDQLSALEQDINQDSSNPMTGVKKWVSDNQDVVNAWFK